VYDKSRDNEGGRESNTSSECFPLAKMPGPGRFASTLNVCVGGESFPRKFLPRVIPPSWFMVTPEYHWRDRTLLGYDYPREKFPRIEFSPSTAKGGKLTRLEYFLPRGVG